MFCFAAQGTAEVPQLEVLDGQQRITSLGRFVAGMLTIVRHGTEQTFSSLPEGDRELIERRTLLAYTCDGTEAEINDWVGDRLRGRVGQSLSSVSRWTARISSHRDVGR